MCDDWIEVQTIEAESGERRDWSIAPNPNSPGNVDYFLVQDPFNLRMGIVPIFRMNADGTLDGLGTAFGVAKPRTLLTADHVLSEFRERSEVQILDERSFGFSHESPVVPVAYLCPGMIFGTVGVSDKHFPVIEAIASPIKPGNDPMKQLRGEPDFAAADVAVLKTEELRASLHTLEINPTRTSPRVGERVVAIGFPDLKMVKSRNKGMTGTLHESMYAAYGRVTKLLPDGRDVANHTPVFQVDAYWPPGMSGGPVFNEFGDVVGIVSRSIIDSDGGGTGWAAWLGYLPELGQLLDQPLSA